MRKSNVCCCDDPLPDLMTFYLFLQLISQNQQAFIQLLNSGGQGGGQGAGQGAGLGGESGQGGELGMVPPSAASGTVAIQVTAQEKESIDRVSCIRMQVDTSLHVIL